MTPAEIIAKFRCSGPRYGGSGPCEICRGHAEQSVAALVEHGYAIVPAVPPQALEAPQGVESSRGGMTGPLAHADSSTGLSGLSRVRALHQPTEGMGFNCDEDDTPGSYGRIAQVCISCGTPGEQGVRWPCPTLAALDSPDVTP